MNDVRLLERNNSVEGESRDHDNRSIIAPLIKIKIPKLKTDKDRKSYHNTKSALQHSSVSGKTLPSSRLVICFCNICGKLPAETKEKRLVIDHNHTTNIIRGWLCDPCNGRIGVLESKIVGSVIRNLQNQPSFKYWLASYNLRIFKHLEQNTGYLYYPALQRKTFRHLYTSAFAG